MMEISSVKLVPGCTKWGDIITKFSWSTHSTQFAQRNEPWGVFSILVRRGVKWVGGVGIGQSEAGKIDTLFSAAVFQLCQLPYYL